MNEFASITKPKGQNKLVKNKLITEETYKGHETPTYSVKGLREFKDIKGKSLSTYIRHQLLSNVG